MIVTSSGKLEKGQCYTINVCGNLAVVTHEMLYLNIILSCRNYALAD